MPVVKKYRIEVQKDHISKIATGSPESALAELIWNSFDADATKVEIWFHEGEIGIDEILIRDNGVGIPYGDAEKLFVSLGGSWKARKQKTSKGRFLHGKDGEGRFKAFVLGRVVDWNVIYKDGEQYMQYTIQELADSQQCKSTHHRPYHCLNQKLYYHQPLIHLVQEYISSLHQHS